MPFKSEKQRRYLWAEHPEIAKRWAHKYPESNKGLPMYANQDKKHTPKEKAAQLDVLGLISPYVNKSIHKTSSILADIPEQNDKSAADKLVKVDIPHSDKPTYAGQEREEGENHSGDIKSEQPQARDPENAINSLLQKISIVLSQPMSQALENRKAMEEAREPAYQPKNPGIRRYSAPVAAIPPPMGMQQAPQQAQPQAQPAPQQGAGMNSPSANPIQSFGPLSASGNINGNAAFGQKNSPDSLKTAAGNPILSQLTSMDMSGLPDASDLDIDEEYMKTSSVLASNPEVMLLPAGIGALSGGLRGLLYGPKGKRMLSGLRGAATGGTAGLGAGLGVGLAHDMLSSSGRDTREMGTAIGGGGGALLGSVVANSLIPKVTSDKKKQQPKEDAEKEAFSARTFGEKIAIEIIQPYGKHKIQPSFPKQMQSSVVSKQEADAIARAMAASAPHDALGNTRVDLYGTRVKDMQQRMVDNPRLSPYQRWLNRYDSIEGLPDKTQLLPDAYHPDADNVWLPSGNPGVLMHELGHSIDFNGYPNTTPRMLLAGLYKRTAPTLWTEHAAWRKGKQHFLEGAAQNKLPPELVAKTLRDASRGKRMGLGSYWGAGLGTLAGGIGGAALALGNGIADPRFPLLGAGLGGAVGGLGGLTIGNLMAESNKFDTPEATQKYLNQYASAYAKKHKVPFAQAQQDIQNLAQNLIEKKERKTKSKSKKKPSKKPELAKAAVFRNLHNTPTDTGPEQMQDALFRFNQLRALARPSDDMLKRHNLSRKGFQHEMRRIVRNSQDKDRFELSKIAPNPALRAGLAGAAGLAGTGLAAYAGGGADAFKYGLPATALAAGGAYAHGHMQRENLKNTAKLLKNYGLLNPQTLRQAYPLIGDDYRLG